MTWQPIDLSSELPVTATGAYLSVVSSGDARTLRITDGRQVGAATSGSHGQFVLAMQFADDGEHSALGWVSVDQDDLTQAAAFWQERTGSGTTGSPNVFVCGFRE